MRLELEKPKPPMSLALVNDIRRNGGLVWLARLPESFAELSEAEQFAFALDDHVHPKDGLTASPGQVARLRCEYFAARAWHLSPREIEVVMLVVEGHSNPEIAARLSITRETVNKHLDHIFKKAGFHQRGQFAGMMLLLLWGDSFAESLERGRK